MAAVDAQLFWLSAKVPNDQFLLYAFGGTPADIEAAVGGVRGRAGRCPELGLRAADNSRWRYPRWEPRPITDEQFRVHDGAGQSWQECLDAVARLPQLDGTEAPWRVHVFPRVAGIPGGVEGSVVLVQISHALGDGTRSAALAATLLGRRQPPPPVGPPDRGVLLWRAGVAAREHRRLMREIDAGSADPPGVPRPRLSVNAGPRRAAVVRTLVVDRARLPGRTVTVGALVAIADALGGYLTRRGEDIGRLGAEVPISHGGYLQAHNNFRSVGVDLHPELSRVGRADRIAAQLTAHRRRGEHPALRASARAFASVPAPVLRWGVGQFDPSARTGAVSGHTVVSSVNRGPADLVFGGHRVLFTAGYPALSPVMGLTHGVHGIGDTVAISVHADPTVVDIEDYLDRLADALGRRS
jgi:hypothetical protein